MKSSDCPPWIDPGNAFRVVVKCAGYEANLEYGMITMEEQCHDIWVDGRSGYNLDKFVEEMATKIIWGPSQQLLVWGVDAESGTKWKVTTNEQFANMLFARWDVRVLEVSCEVVDNEGYKKQGPDIAEPAPFNESSAHAASGVTNAEHYKAAGDTCSSPDQVGAVDWNNLVILAEPNADGYANVLANEDEVYEAFGFKAADEAAQAPEVAIPVMTREMHADMMDAAITVDDNDSSEPLADWDRDNPDVSVGTVYPCMKDFRLAVRQHAIVKEFELCTEKTDKTRFRGCCSAEGCPWKIRARIQADSSVRVQINTNKHTCASRSRVVGRMASQAWVAERAIPLLKRKPGMGATDLKEELENKYKISIPYQTVWYGRLRASNKLFGKWDDSFDWLYRFKAEVDLRSPGSVVEIGTVEIDGKIYFNKFFCAFKASIHGFIGGCRPYISIDSTALNGQWNGHMPAANAIDGHNWMFPLAFGLFDSETKENWIWFMEQLQHAIGHVHPLAIHSDACKGLSAAVKKVFPLAEHRECFKHLMDNMKKTFTGSVYAKYMWPAARAYLPDKHKYLLDKVTSATAGVEKWLNEHHKLKWTRSQFSPDIKCEYINNNLAECWNAWIKEYKDLPVDILADAIREKTVILFEKRRRVSIALNGVILPAVFHQLNAASKGLGHLRLTKGDFDQAEVTEIYKDEEVRRHVVYLADHICTCREWQVSGKPCPHALAVITTDRQPKMENFVDMAFSVQKFQAAYAGVIPNITDKSQWPEVDKGFKLLPPIAKPKQLGRQKKNRYLSCLERTGKATRQVTCDACKQLGHRKGSWRCALTGTKKRKRTRKTNTKVGRKKAKTDEAAATAEPVEVSAKAPQQAVLNTPRTRARAAKEAAEAKAAEQAAASTKAAKRKLTLEAPVHAPAPANKMTPKKKQLATKVKKTNK